MLTITVCALLLTIPFAIGVMRWEGTLILVPVFSADESRFSAYTHPSKALNAFLGLIFGGLFGVVLAYGIGLFMPTHMIVAEEIKLTPIHRDGKTFYVGVSTEEVPVSRGVPYQASYYLFLEQTDGGMALEKFPVDDSVKIYEDNASGGRLVQLAPALLAKNDESCNLFACPVGSARYEVHIPTNGVGTF